MGKSESWKVYRNTTGFGTWVDGVFEEEGRAEEFQDEAKEKERHLQG